MDALTNDPVFTFDVDWAPDWVVARIAAALVRRNVRATWFITHDSPVLKDLLSEDSFEVGLHPNFLPGSSQGSTVAEVMETLKGWVPSARSVRMHTLYQGERLLGDLTDRYGIENDASIYLQRSANITPHAVCYREGGPLLRRFPHYFQDNMVINLGFDWALGSLPLQMPGLKIFNFHPLHVALNSNSMACYERLKSVSTSLMDVSEKTVDAVKNSTTEGVETFFHALLEYVDGKKTCTISDLSRSMTA